MFSLGDYIVYGTCGVCQVDQIGPVSLPGVSGTRMYYTLIPVYDKGRTVFTPVDNSKVKMRPILTAQEAEELIREVGGLTALWVSDEKKREEIYKNAFNACDCRELVRIIKTITERGISRAKIGKKVTAQDDRYCRLAENALYGELAISLGITKNEAKKRVMEKDAVLS